MVKSLISGAGLLIERMKWTVTLKETEQKKIKNLTVQVTSVKNISKQWFTSDKPPNSCSKKATTLTPSLSYPLMCQLQKRLDPVS